MWEAMGRGSPAELDAHDRAYRRWLRREWAARRFAAYIATDPAGAPLGSGAVWLVPSQPRPGAAHLPYFPYVLSMYTEPAARGRGVASRVVRELIAWSTERGYPRVTLHASVMGRGVYTRLGFQPTNELRLDLGAGRSRRRAGRRRTR